LPMMEGVLNLTEIFSAGQYADPKKFVSRAMEKVTRQFTDAAMVAGPGLLGPLSPTSSLTKTLKRYFDPVKRGKRIPEDMPSELRHHPAWGGTFRAFYKALQEARAKSPIWSSDVLPQTDRWGIPQMESNGQLHELINPIKTVKTRKSTVETYLNDLGLGLTNPSGRIGGIELSQEQYNRYKEIANTATSFMTNPDQKSIEVNLLGALNNQIDIIKREEAKGELILPGDIISMLRRVDDKFFEHARRILRSEDESLDNAIKTRALTIKATGSPP
jgi:hypothetical protein